MPALDLKAVSGKTCDDCGATGLKEWTYTRVNGVGVTRCEGYEEKARGGVVQGGG